MLRKEETLEKIEGLLCTDNKVEFASFLRNHLESSGLSTPFFSSSYLLKRICYHRAVGCAAVLLKGETGLSVDLNVTLEGGMSPLHLAAQSLSYGLTKMFLRHGAQAKLHSNHDPAMFPLSVSLKALCHNRCVSDWTPKKSVFKLLYIFCLPQLKEPLGTIKLLASKISKRQVESVCLYCVKEGEVVQLAALLIAAWDKLLAPFSSDGMDSSLVWEYILRDETELEHEISLETDRNGSRRLPNPLKCRKTNLISARKLLTILWRALHVIEKYRNSGRPTYVPSHEVPFDISYLIYSRCDINIKPEDVLSDDVECLRPRLRSEEAAKLKKDIEKKIRAGADIYTPFVSVPKPQVPYDLVSRLSVEGDLHMKQKDLLPSDAKCLLPKLESKVEGETNSSVSPCTSEDGVKHVRSRSMVSTVAGVRDIGAADVPLSSDVYLSSRSLHTHQGWYVNTIKPFNRQLVMKAPSPKFLGAVKLCARLISTAKRFL